MQQPLSKWLQSALVLLICAASPAELLADDPTCESSWSDKYARKTSVFTATDPEAVDALRQSLRLIHRVRPEALVDMDQCTDACVAYSTAAYLTTLRRLEGEAGVISGYDLHRQVLKRAYLNKINRKFYTYVNLHLMFEDLLPHTPALVTLTPGERSDLNTSLLVRELNAIVEELEERLIGERIHNTRVQISTAASQKVLQTIDSFYQSDAPVSPNIATPNPGQWTSLVTESPEQKISIILETLAKERPVLFGYVPNGQYANHTNGLHYFPEPPDEREYGHAAIIIGAYRDEYRSLVFEILNTHAHAPRLFMHERDFRNSKTMIIAERRILIRSKTVWSFDPVR